MRKLLFFFALLIMGVAHAEPDVLRVSLATGEPVTFGFAAEPEISFTGHVLSVKSKLSADPVRFELDDVVAVEFVTNSGFDAADAQAGISVTAMRDSVVFGNLPENSAVSVYSLDGRMVLVTFAEGSWMLDRGMFGQGVYIVKINNFVTKISI